MYARTPQAVSIKSEPLDGEDEMLEDLVVGPEMSNSEKARRHRKKILLGIDVQKNDGDDILPI